MTDHARRWIDQLDLEPHPEGGYYRETYRSADTISSSAFPDRFDGARNAAALIYFLLPGDSFSALHRIQQDEAWHFYGGAPLTLHLLSPDGSYQTRTLGRAVADGHHLQTVVPARTWFGATVSDEDRFALVGCTTAPAFEFSDFELADPEALVETFPQHRTVIETLTR